MNKNKLNIAFDSKLLFNDLHYNEGRTGIYFVAYNIANRLLNIEYIE